jgi:hypothetical protein
MGYGGAAPTPSGCSIFRMARRLLLEEMFDFFDAHKRGARATSQH